MLLKGKIAVITGGSQGIGKAIARLFAKEGACVIICARNETKAKEAATEIKKDAESCVEAVRCDVSVKSEVDRVVGYVAGKYKRIDILINNAGIQEFTSFLEISEEDWDRHFDINVKGTFLFSQAVAKIMKDKGGCKIVNLSSDSGVAPVPLNAGAYCSSKSAIIGLTRVIAKELGRYGIYCNAICPGGILETGMLANYHEVFGGRDIEDAELAALGRLGSTDDVARVALFFASDMSNHVTGERILVTGGDIMTQ
jgi:NAD(P)-dependent dehydrogenase (short-subunit alcohol dehydrogenase family)